MTRWIGKTASPAIIATAASLLLVASATATFAAGPANDSPQPPYSAPGTALPASQPARGTALGADEPVRQATYQTDPDYRTSIGGTVAGGALAPNPNARNQAEPMPLDPAGRNPADAAFAGQHGHRSTPVAPSSTLAILTMFGSLAVVLGLFLGLMWFLRRGLPKGTRQLSGEVVEVLGRAPLAGRQQMHLIRFGNRLLLVSVTPGGAETLAEITDPVEVDRLAGICQQGHVHSTTNTFRQIFRQLSDGRAGRDVEPKKANGKTIASAKSSRSTGAEDDDV